MIFNLTFNQGYIDEGIFDQSLSVYENENITKIRWFPKNCGA